MHHFQQGTLTWEHLIHCIELGLKVLSPQDSSGFESWPLKSSSERQSRSSFTPSKCLLHKRHKRVLSLAASTRTILTVWIKYLTKLFTYDIKCFINLFKTSLRILWVYGDCECAYLLNVVFNHILSQMFFQSQPWSPTATLQNKFNKGTPLLNFFN